MMHSQCFAFFALLRLLPLMLLILIFVNLSTVKCEPSQEETKTIFCSKKIRPIISPVYAHFACMAEVMGANFSKPNSPMPERFTKKFNPEIAKWSVLHTMDAFTKWYCSKFDANYKIVQSTSHNLNLNREENEMLFRCIIDEFSVTIEEEICINKTSVGKALEVDRYKCLREVSGKSDCIKEMMTDDVPENKFNEWLCQEEPNVEKYVTTKFACLSQKDKALKYGKCVDTAVSKLLKSK